MVTLVHYGADRKYDSILAWLVLQCGTLEVPYDYPIPEVTFLPDTLPPKHLAPSASYYKDGGMYAPDRWRVEERRSVTASWPSPG